MIPDPWLEALYRLLILLPPSLLSLLFHEIAHARVAGWLGDPTAERAGRLSWNPLRHLDPVGSLLVPAALALLGLPPVGWARHVPFDPSVLRGWRLQALALSGPAASLSLALLFAGALWGMHAFGAGESLAVPRAYLQVGLTINLIFFFFNLLPIPPLDGAKVWIALLPERRRGFLLEHEKLGMALIAGMAIAGWLGALVAYPVDWMLSLLSPPR